MISHYTIQEKRNKKSRVETIKPVTVASGDKDANKKNEQLTGKDQISLEVCYC